MPDEVQVLQPPEDRSGPFIGALIATLPDGPGRTKTVLQTLAEHFTGPLFVAATELWVAARTDGQLREAVTALEARVGRGAHRHTVQALGVDESVPGARELVQATLDLVRGLGLANTLTDDAVRRRRILDRWADILDTHLARTGRSAEQVEEARP